MRVCDQTDQITKNCHYHLKPSIQSIKLSIIVSQNENREEQLKQKKTAALLTVVRETIYCDLSRNLGNENFYLG